MIKVGLVGAGYIAESHARGFAALPPSRARLTAVTSRRYDRAAQLAQRFDADAIPDFESLLQQVDAVSICTPTPSHAGYALAALQAGVHVLCEKPLARTLSDGRRLLGASEQANVKFMTAHVSRYEPEHRLAREVLLRGDIGDLRMASYSAVGPAADWAGDNWFADFEQSGGPVLDLAIHGFDYLLWLFDSPVRRVYAVGNGHDADRYALVTLRFENGGIGLVETSWAHPRSEPFTLRVELTGTQGRIAWDYDQVASMHVVSGDTARRPLLMVGEDSFLDQSEAFVRCIETNEPPPITCQDGLAALKVSLAALESLETGKAVEL